MRHAAQPATRPGLTDLGPAGVCAALVRSAFERDTAPERIRTPLGTPATVRWWIPDETPAHPQGDGWASVIGGRGGRAAVPSHGSQQQPGDRPGNGRSFG